MAAHTPGPWKWDGKFTVEIPHATGMACFRTMPEDARLIAAAPELLDELQRSQDVLHGLIEYFDEGHERREIYAQLARNSAAIAKAEGD